MRNFRTIFLTLLLCAVVLCGEARGDAALPAAQGGEGAGEGRQALVTQDGSALSLDEYGTYLDDLKAFLDAPGEEKGARGPVRFSFGFDTSADPLQEDGESRQPLSLRVPSSVGGALDVMEDAGAYGEIWFRFLSF